MLTFGEKHNTLRSVLSVFLCILLFFSLLGAIGSTVAYRLFHGDLLQDAFRSVDLRSIKITTEDGKVTTVTELVEQPVRDLIESLDLGDSSRAEEIATEFEDFIVDEAFPFAAEAFRAYVVDGEDLLHSERMREMLEANEDTFQKILDAAQVDVPVADVIDEIMEQIEKTDIKETFSSMEEYVTAGTETYALAQTVFEMVSKVMIGIWVSVALIVLLLAWLNFSRPRSLMVMVGIPLFLTGSIIWFFLKVIALGEAELSGTAIVSSLLSAMLLPYILFCIVPAVLLLVGALVWKVLADRKAVTPGANDLTTSW